MVTWPDSSSEPAMRRAVPVSVTSESGAFPRSAAAARASSAAACGSVACGEGDGCGDCAVAREAQTATRHTDRKERAGNRMGPQICRRNRRRLRGKVQVRIVAVKTILTEGDKNLLTDLITNRRSPSPNDVDRNIAKFRQMVRAN